MASDVLMPRLSDSMEEGTVLKWLVEEGAEVKRGQPLVEIETDKANMTYESDADGVLLEVLAQEGDTLPIGEPIARVGEPGELGVEGEAEGEPQGEPSAAGEAEGEAQPADEGEEPEGEAEPADEPGPEPAQVSEPAAEADADPESEAEPEPQGDGEAERAAAAAGPQQDTARAFAPPASGDGGERLKASPVARRVAGELGVELAQLEGSGPGGRIVKADVEAAAGTRAGEAPPRGGQAPPRVEAAPAPERPAGQPAAKAEGGAKGEVTVQELSRLQQTVTRRMSESKATVPDFVLELDVDMTLCIELRERLKQQADPPPSFNDMIVKATASALRNHPRVNGAYRDGHYELYSRVNVGVAVAARDALVVPVIADADQKSLGEISRQARRLIERVRDGQITPPELSGGTFTVSNLGMYGIERFTAIINPPQAAILTVGALMKKASVDDRGRVGSKDKLTLSLVCDHRILYGADGAEFLAHVRELLEQPLSLAL